ncbi:hypothetical protein BJY04DRAFT_214133 [Aspergillus karnatakaensis]|uniref:uncharacterized protein n=1 Tax=Aspergillus karnatakaensis TaxID=1810916 RepID=UPI003CCE010A
MAEALGAVAACDQLFGTFRSLYRELKKAYDIIKHTRGDIGQVKDRTKVMKQLWRFFGDTMRKVNEIEEFSVDLERYRGIDKSLKKQSSTIIHRIESILRALRPLLPRKPISPLKDFSVRLTWLFRDREAMRLLYVDMELLARYMHIFITLVHTQIAVRQYELTKSTATQAQIDALRYSLKKELKEIRQVVEEKAARLTVPVNWQREVRHEVRRAVRHEVSQMRSVGLVNGSSSGSSTPLSPSAPPPSTPPTTPSEPNSTMPIVEESIERSETIVEPTVPVVSRAWAVHDSFCSPSETSYVSLINETYRTHENVEPPAPNVAVDISEAADIESNGGDGGIYMPTALFGPPKPGRRPPPAQVSVASLNQNPRISSISPATRFLRGGEA